LSRTLRLTGLIAGLLGAGGLAAAPANFTLPAFPVPALVREGGPVKEISSLRLMRDLFKGGVKATDNFEASDVDYALLRVDSLGNLAGWLETACKAVGLELPQARARAYDGVAFSRLLSVGTSLGALRESEIKLAMPVGVLVCRRDVVWGDLPADGADDAYVIFATDTGILVYDPPTRQLAALADFPNKARISRIRF
jgi:hypothetical protein